MQDALLCYFIAANMLRAGCFGDAIKPVRQVWRQFRACFVGAGSTKVSMRPVTEVPDLFGEMDEWVARLTRMESYVTSMA
jgi:hypothetical protein